VAGVNLAANIIMNYLLMQRMGINGIALSTTLVHIISLLLLVFFVYFSTKRAALVVGQ
jgi:putative peptidoglycan lipid II flippase